MFTGERDLVDQRMFDHRGPGGRAEPGNHIDHPVREPDLFGQLGHSQTGQRRLLGRFHHDGAAGGQCRAPFPGRHQDRKVPRDDLPGHANRFATGVAQIIAANRDRAAVNLVGVPGVIPQAVDRQRKVDVATVVERLSVVERFEPREVIDFRFHSVGESIHQPSAVAGVHFGPITGLERMTSRFRRGVDVIGVPFSDLRDFLLGRRVDGRKGLSRCGGNPLAIDETLGFADVNFRSFSGGCGHGKDADGGNKTEGNVDAHCNEIGAATGGPEWQASWK